VYAGLRDAWRCNGNELARAMLVKLCDWALLLSSHLTEERMPPCCAPSMAASTKCWPMWRP
jgi:hypothetical protein